MLSEVEAREVISKASGAALLNDYTWYVRYTEMVDPCDMPSQPVDYMELIKEEILRRLNQCLAK